MIGPDTSGSKGWWASLKHGGLLVAPSKLTEFFPVEPEPLTPRVAETLRGDVTRVLADDDAHIPKLLDTVLHDVLKLKVGWTRGSSVDKRWSRKAITGEMIRPRRLWEGSGSRLPVFVPEKGSSGSTGRLGVGRGRRHVSRAIEWLRKANEKIAVLTNGRQWRLIHAGADYDAWCEWDVGLWFEEGVPSPQVTAIRALLGRTALERPSEDEPPPLLAAIQASRNVEAELSATLGERVRRAVEHLIQVSSPALVPALEDEDLRIRPNDIYIAACRLVMRCVVVFFAEARELLPRSNAVYNDAYSLQGLREQLLRTAGGRAAERLRHAHGAWPRLLSLFGLIHDGSDHEALPITEYGGALFRRGDPSSTDPVLRAMSLFESAKNTPSDADALQILDFLSRSKVKVRQGRSSTWVDAPVDFSNLSSEYIGILYEGLLDFELKRAPEGEPVVFLNVGDQPALPFSRLNELTEKGMKELLEKLKKSSRKLPAGEDEVEEENEEEESTEEDESEEDAEAKPEEPEPEDETPETASDLARLAREMVTIWTEKAVKAARLVRPLRGKKATEPAAVSAYEADVTKVAKSLVQKLVLPGEWCLVRWGGTRKGAGTFYTKPQLAGPMTRRTLQPLAYEPVREEKDEETGLVNVLEWAPRKPEEVLRLKVCDPAMGSGSFLVSALRYLTDALWESLNHHGRVEHTRGKSRCRLPDGTEIVDAADEPLPVPTDRPDFEARTKARLKRYVVESCLYGVDIDPLAVELARLALWIETMAPDLPMTFLDHKLKCGNSLVGCWFDRFQDYPIMAWEREGGDKTHTKFVHHFREHVAKSGKWKGKLTKRGDVWTQAIKDRKKTIRAELRRRVLVESKGDLGGVLGRLFPVEESHTALRDAFERIHTVPPWKPEEQEARFRELTDDDRHTRLKYAFDTWCAIWFWPGDRIDLCPSPIDFRQKQEDVSGEVRELVEGLSREHRFFHWELEFPDVFDGPESGFDAVIGNPPWEIQKPNSKEFFSNIDPLYRAYGKQEALDRQQGYFHLEVHERAWLAYCARLKALSSWTKSAGNPWGDLELVVPSARRALLTTKRAAENDFKAAWKPLLSQRRGYADPEHPFLHQGSADINTYKMFLEAAHALARRGGEFGLIVPSGIYTDKGSTALRELLLGECSWEWLFGFENRDRIFDIHRSFKFCPVIVRKGGQTTAIRAAFMRHDLSDWAEGERYVLPYPRARVEEFSPRSKAVLEIRSSRDLQVLTSQYRYGGIFDEVIRRRSEYRYALGDFHMSNDSRHFPPLSKWRERSYRESRSGLWSDDNDRLALPLYEGRMIGAFDFSAKKWVSGKGRSAVWQTVPHDSKRLGPQYLVDRAAYLGWKKGLKGHGCRCS